MSNEKKLNVEEIYKKLSELSLCEYTQLLYLMSKRLPTIENEKWILFSEKMPPDGQKVLLSCKHMMFDYVTVGTIENGNRGKSYIADEDTFMISTIIAWKPLPEPHKISEES